jgi:hypothetical protein
VRLLLALIASVALAAALAPAAGAVPLVLSDGSTLINADTNNLLNPGTPITITGMQAGETLLGIDQRPATGELFGLGSTSRIYLLNPSTGAATQVGPAGAFTLSGTAFGTDFNPTVDRLRVVSDMEQNLRISPIDSFTVTDALLNPPGNVVAAAYTNNRAGAAATTLYDIDSASGRLLRQGGVDGMGPSPNGGALTDIGPLMVPGPISPELGFDIGADAVALATITGVPAVSKLYGINLSSGLATDLGTIGTGATPYRGLAIMPARIRLTSATASATEGGTALFEVTRNAPATGAVSVQYATAPGTASDGEDFTPTSGTLAWEDKESGSKTIAVPVVGDNPAEGDETFTVSLSNVTGADAVLGAPATATATIAANDVGPTFQFESGAVGAAEGGSAALSVTRVGSTTSPVSVGYTTAPGSAGENDYTPATGTLSWAAGDSAPKTISIPITDDTGAEPAETFGVNLLSPAGGATVGAPATATVTIAASDAAAPAAKVTLKLGGATKQKVRTVRRKGLAITARVSAACKLKATVKRGKKQVGKKTRSLAKGKTAMRVKLSKKQRKKLRPRQKLKVSATCAAGTAKSKTAHRTIKLKRG